MSNAMIKTITPAATPHTTPVNTWLDIFYLQLTYRFLPKLSKQARLRCKLFRKNHHYSVFWHYSGKRPYRQGVRLVFPFSRLSLL
jgi:hypothetical protein